MKGVVVRPCAQPLLSRLVSCWKGRSLPTRATIGITPLFKESSQRFYRPSSPRRWQQPAPIVHGLRSEQYDQVMLQPIRLPSELRDQPVLAPKLLLTQAEKLQCAEEAACQLAVKLLVQTAISKAVQAVERSQIEVMRSREQRHLESLSQISEQHNQQVSLLKLQHEKAVNALPSDVQVAQRGAETLGSELVHHQRQPEQMHAQLDAEVLSPACTKACNL